MSSSNVHTVCKNAFYVVNALGLIDLSIWTSWGLGPDMGNDARMQRSQNLAPDIYMQCISFRSLPSASVIPVNFTFWCLELLRWCQPPKEFEITDTLFGLSIYRICVHTYPNHIYVDAKNDWNIEFRITMACSGFAFFKNILMMCVE